MSNTIESDMQGGVTALPFEDNRFPVVVFDPPRIKIGAQMGIYEAKGTQDGMLRYGFSECMRVLKPDGVLIFRLCEYEIPADTAWEAIGQKPLFGHRSGRIFWGFFMKEKETRA